MRRDAFNRDDDDDDDEGEEKCDKPSGKGLQQELLKTRSIIVSDKISQELAGAVYAQLIVLTHRSPSEPICVYVNSSGGDAESGFGIHDMLRFCEAPVHTVCCGICASAAVDVFLGADPGRRFSLPNSRFMIHQPSWRRFGSASDIAIAAEEIQRLRRRSDEILADAIGKKVEEVAKNTDRDYWMDAEQALEYGLVNKIITTRSEVS